MKTILLSIVLFISYTGLSQNFGTGLIKDPKGYEKVGAVAMPLGYGDDLPESVSHAKYLPPIGHQGDYGTCAGWSSTYYLATMEYAMLMDITSPQLIQANTFDPFYTYLNCTGQEDYFDCADGLYMSRTASWLVENDCKRYGYNTLDCGDKISDRNSPTNSLLNFTDYYRLTDYENTREENINSIKQTLADGHCVFIGVTIYSDFNSIGENGLYIRDVENSYQRGGHAMTMIGYDDNKFGGVFIIVNSWGKDWADGGICYMKYNDFFGLDPEAYSFDVSIRDMKNGEGCVFGDCEEGYGRYVYSVGDVYEGDFIKGERAGYGVYTWSDDTHYGGEWFEKHRHGMGYYKELDYHKGTYWKEGSYNGDEVVINELNYEEVDEEDVVDEEINELFLGLSISEINDFLDEDYFLDLIEDSEISGCLYGDCEDGLSIYIPESKGYIYFGIFENGNFNGYGKMIWLKDSRGHVYEGEYVASSREGNGFYKYPSGNRFMGEWSDGARNGIGTFIFSDGSYNSGEYIDNEFQGDGFGFASGDENVLSDPIMIKEETIKPDKPLQD